MGWKFNLAIMVKFAKTIDYDLTGVKLKNAIEALYSNGIYDLAIIANLSDEELLSIKGVGPRSVKLFRKFIDCIRLINGENVI